MKEIDKWLEQYRKIWETRFEQLDEMLANPTLDMIDICLPPAAHAPVAIAALKAGKHVFCEKPIALAPRYALPAVLAVGCHA